MTKFYTSVERAGNYILHRGYKNGKRFSERVKFRPTFYISSQNNTTDKTLIGNRPVEAKTFDSMGDAKDFIEQYKDIGNLDVCGSTNYVTQFIQENYPGEIQFDMKDINIFAFDIEYDTTEGYADINLADKEINSIACKSSKSDTYHLLTLKGYDKNKTISGIDPDNIQHMEFDTEAALLRRFIQIWTNDYPDVITGWNVVYFDIMYIITRIARVLGESRINELSPWGRVQKQTNRLFNKEQSTYSISGIAVIDYMDAFKKFGYKYGPQESYKLDQIAYVVLGQKKLDYSEYGSLSELYKQNPQLFFDYNLVDTHLIQRLEDETGLLSLVLTVAYSGGSNYKDAFGTVGIWENTLYRKLREKGLVPPLKCGPGERANELVGGYVKDPVVGKLSWVVSFDLNSLYPHLMLQYNMSPETYLPDERKYVSQEMILAGDYRNDNPNISVCANGVCFNNKKKGIIPEIIEEYYANRKKIKQEMLKVEQEIEKETDSRQKDLLKRRANQLHNSQMAIKIAMNSLYGATANIHFLYYIAEMAEAITTSGQLSIRYAEKSVNNYLNKVLKTSDIDYVAYIDTDSIYVNMEPIITSVYGSSDVDRIKAEEFLDKICSEKIENVITKGYEKLAKDMGAYRNAMSMKREKITDKCLFVAKKRYVMNVLNSEGVHYETPKISVTGLESVRSSTPEICREKLKDSFKVILNGTEDETRNFIDEFRELFNSLPVEQIAKISGTDDIEKFTDRSSLYRKGTPIHVRGSILYNHHLKKNKLDNRYELIQSGDKIKFVYLKLPNPIQENVVAFPNVLPKEMNLEKYIDRDTQFDKVFLNPLEIILESVGWSAQKLDTLDDFFV